MSAKQWPSDWMRAALGTIKGGTLYPLRTRCEAAGWIAVEWRVGADGPERK